MPLPSGTGRPPADPQVHPGHHIRHRPPHQCARVRGQVRRRRPRVAHVCVSRGNLAICSFKVPPTFSVSYGFFFNPFLPTGQFKTPKLIIIKCLIDVLFFSVVLMFLYVEKDVNLA